MTPIVLAYSGGLNASAAVPWLAGQVGADVVCVTLDLGQGRELESVRERALAAGAARAHVLDVREEFAGSFVLPALQAGADADGPGAIATALSRPLIARRLAEIARIEGTDVVAHGCADRDDQRRLETPARELLPGARIIAPACEWGMTRPDVIAYARARGVQVPAAAADPVGADSNLWGRSVRYAALDDPCLEPPAGVYTLTKDPDECPESPAAVELRFERGVPVAVNGIDMAFTDLIASVGTIAGAHGVGRVETTVEGHERTARREVREAPAAAVLGLAHRALERAVTHGDLLRLKRKLAIEYDDLIERGGWFSPARGALDAFVAAVQERVTGVVRVRLFKGSAQAVVRVRAPGARAVVLRKAV